MYAVNRLWPSVTIPRPAKDTTEIGGNFAPCRIASRYAATVSGSWVT